MKIPAKKISPNLLVAALSAALAAPLLAASPTPPATSRGPSPFGMGPPVTPPIVDAAAAAKTPTADGPFQPTWDSIKANYKIPAWFVDAKFGITMTWGLYSIPAHHNEWYAKHMYGDPVISAWHAQTYGSQETFGYKDFIPQFTAPKFNAQEWADLCKKAGARYVVPTCEHHDGFSLWDSALNPWNSVQMGPKKDIMGELAAAVRKDGMKFGLANHSIEHYNFIQPLSTLKTDLNDPKFADFYWTQHNDANLQRFLELWVAKNLELIDKYQPDLLWFDNGVNARAYDPLKLKVQAYYYNRARQWGREVTLDTKGAACLAGSVLDFEKPLRGPRGLLAGVWEIEDPIGSTWGYTADQTFRGPQAIVNELCDIVAKGGNLLLNLSPQGDGSINQRQQDTLTEVGKWLETNGPAIYGTHSWITNFEMPAPTAAAARGMPATRLSYRFTVKGDDLYVIAQAWPGPEALITCLSTGKVEGTIKSVTLLGSPGELKFTQTTDGLHITLPETQPCKYAYALKITGLKMNPPGPNVPATFP